ncbi:MAG: cyclodeaminase/cyclohydrolase family protein [Oscillospiraceae bacterium]|nr:cyclodeaminase/cyclohydrolase family protein [Oscillospiraceae bacterium]
MLLIDYTIKGFAQVLGSDAPAPGGGSTAALEGALGISLLRMVGALTAGRKKYAEHEAFIARLIEQAEEIQTEFLEVIDEDTRAFNQVSAVFEMPKGTDEEKTARKNAMQEALKACTKTPYKMMQLCDRSAALASAALDKYNTNAASDFGVAALSLKAAVQGAWLNILINIGGIDDAAFVEEYRSGGQAILAKVLPAADHIYQSIEQSL